MNFRRRYYNLFSSFYDGFIRLDSRDAGESMRSFLAETARLDRGCTVVDLCTGTGSSALKMAQERKVRVIGIDFSEGMFIMMEHLPPNRRLIKLLYLIRIYVLGTRGVRSFTGTEEEKLARFFEKVQTVVAPGGKTKAVYGFKPPEGVSGNQPRLLS